MNNQQTLVITYVCTALAQCLIISRLVCRLTTRGEKLRPDDKWMAFATVPLFVRLATVHTALTNGSNNEWKGALLSAEQIALREIGAKVILVSRVNYAGLWVVQIPSLIPLLIDGQSLVYESLHARLLFPYNGRRKWLWCSDPNKPVHIAGYVHCHISLHNSGMPPNRDLLGNSSGTA